MRRRLIILGTGGLAREVAMVMEQINAREHRWQFLGFVGDSSEQVGMDLGTGMVLGDDAWLLSQTMELDLVVGIGYPKVRARVLLPYLSRSSQFAFPNLIHPHTSIDCRRVELGRGNVITSGCAFTCHIEVTDFNLFNLNVTVGHDARIGSFNVINPGSNISGRVHLGDRVLAGTGCQILENIVIGSDVIIGAGAVVLGNIADGETVVGVPAKPIQKKAENRL